MLKREEGGKGASDRRRDVLIPRESGGRPVRAPCLMRGSRFPYAYCGGAPRRLLNSVDFGGFQRFSTSATRDWNGGIIAGFL